MEKRKKVDVKNEEGKKEKLFLYYDGESVSGKVCVCVCVCEGGGGTMSTFMFIWSQGK